jgi:structural maintenance of chromosome 3 (chondroitin sulfate proteoglycan 6)
LVVLLLLSGSFCCVNVLLFKKIEREEVTLRRTIGLKKDEYFLDSKHVSKADVMNLLESSGFSRSNPYYIVQQGKIVQLATMRDAERLNLLKEVAGTKVYDDRRAQSVQILEDTETKKERIEEVLQYIEERLAELEDEKEELREYQQLDRDQRAIEYTIYDKELRGVRQTLEKLDSQRQEEAARRDKTHDASTEELMSELQSEHAKLNAEVAHVERSRRGLEEDKSDAQTALAKVEVDVQELEGLVANEDQDEERIDAGLAKLREDISAAEHEVEEIAPLLAAAKAQHREAESKHGRAKARQDALYGKQTRTSQFATIHERDRWIDGELASLDKATKGKTAQMKRLEDEITKTEETVADNEEEAADRESQILQRKERIEAINKEHREAKKNLDDLSNERKRMWQEDANLDRQIQLASEEVRKAERGLYSAIGKAKSNGLDAVRQLVKKHGIDGVYGPLIELINTADEYKTAVETTAGDQLFNIVVDNDVTASKLITLINKGKFDGRVTFLPLNRLRPQPGKFPAKSKDFVAMIDKIEYDAMFKPAVAQIFGRTLICRDLEVAAHYSRQPGMNMSCVTLEGDKVSRKGALTGGYIDDKVSKLDMQAKASAQRRANDTAQQESTVTKQRIDDLDQKIVQVDAEIKKLESERTRLRDNYEHITSDTSELVESTMRQQQQLDQKRAAISDIAQELARLSEQVKNFREEKGTTLESQLDESDQVELEELTAELQETQAEIKKTMAESDKLETRHTRLRRKLDNNLKRREKELVRQKEGFAMDDRKKQFSVKQSDLGSAREAVKVSGAWPCSM